MEINNNRNRLILEAFKECILTKSEALVLLEKSESSFRYDKLKTQKDIDELSEWMTIIFKDKNTMSNKVTKNTMRKIYYDNDFIGYIGFNKYTIKKKKYLGIGNFMVIPKLQRKGYGSKIIKDIIQNKSSIYDEIYCWVDENNKNAIKFYKKIAEVSSNTNKDGFYYVTLYKK